MISKLLLTTLTVSANAFGVVLNKDKAVEYSQSYRSNGITQLTDIHQYTFDLWDNGFSMDYRYIKDDSGFNEPRYYIATLYRLSEGTTASFTEKNTSLVLIAKTDNVVVVENDESFLTRIFAFRTNTNILTVLNDLPYYEITTSQRVAQNATIAQFYQYAYNDAIFMSFFPITKDNYEKKDVNPLFFPFLFGYSDNTNTVSFRPMTFPPGTQPTVITNSRITLIDDETRGFMLSYLLQIDFVLVKDLSNILTVIASNQAYQDGYNAGLIAGIGSSDVGGANLLTTTVITVIGAVGNFIYFVSGFEIMGVSLMTIIAFIFAFGIIAIVIKVVK